MNKKTGRLDIELLADVFTNLDKILAALAANAGFRFVAVFDARQMFGQRLTTGAWARRRRRSRGCRRIAQALGHLSLRRRQITGHGFLKQVALFSGQCLAACTKAHSAQVGQLKGKRLDFGLGGVQFGIAVSDLRSQSTGFACVFLRLIKQILNSARDPVRECGIRFEAGQLNIKIHA